MADYKEGFLCPICQEDLRSPDNLIRHFNDLHCEEQDLLKSLKGIYGKAKKILKRDDGVSGPGGRFSLNDLSGNGLGYPETVEMGPIVVHTDMFKKMRREKFDHKTSETNKIIIRLDKLLRVSSTDRRQAEQELVPWIDGSTVTRCPSCANSFNLTRRQHHCRLCGSIMCKSCSHFLHNEIAQSIVAPVFIPKTDPDDGPSIGQEYQMRDDIRLCVHCLRMLEARRSAQIAQVLQPIICQLYSHLRKTKVDIEHSIMLYEKMYNSLLLGEKKFHLKDTISLRKSIATQTSILNTLGRKIGALPVALRNDGSENIYEKQLCINIRRSVEYYVKERILVLPSPPTQAELDALYRRSNGTGSPIASPRLLADSGAAGRLPLKLDRMQPSFHSFKISDGWLPTTNCQQGDSGNQSDAVNRSRVERHYDDVDVELNDDEDDDFDNDLVGGEGRVDGSGLSCSDGQDEDPLLEQIEIVRHYIKEARNAHRYEEVLSLEENLKMLRRYRNGQRNVIDQSVNNDSNDDR